MRYILTVLTAASGQKRPLLRHCFALESACVLPTLILY